MIDFLKTHSVTIVLSLILLVIGIVLGLIIKEGDNGIYITASYPQGGTFFVIGKNREDIANTDLKSLDNAQASVLASKIKDLGVDDALSKALREMAKKSDGPFATIPVVIRLHLSNDLSGPVAKACKNTPVYGNSLVAYEVVGNGERPVSVAGLLDIHVVALQFSNCTSGNDGYYDVWISKDYVEKWIHSANVTDADLSVKANIVVADIGI